MREIWQRYAFGDTPLEQIIDPRRPARVQLFRIGAGAPIVLEAGGKEHQFGGLIARIVGAVTEMHARRFERPRNAIDGGAHGFTGGSDGFSGCVG